LQLLAQVIEIFVNVEVKQANWPLYEPDNTAPTATFPLITAKHTAIHQAGHWRRPLDVA